MAETTSSTTVAQPHGSTKEYDEFVAKLAKKLEENGQLILTGAPGTGKTYTAQKIAAQMIFGDCSEGSIQKLASPNYKLVQFHPGYSYSDFVEGLKPEKTDGNVTFKLRDGVFKEFCRAANTKHECVSSETLYEFLCKDENIDNCFNQLTCDGRNYISNSDTFPAILKMKEFLLQFQVEKINPDELEIRKDKDNLVVYSKNQNGNPSQPQENLTRTRDEVKLTWEIVLG